MNKFNLTNEEINQLKAAAKILYKFDAEDDAELNKITGEEDFPFNKYYNAIWTSMENDYFDTYLALKDLGEVIEILADSFQDNNEQEDKDKVEVKTNIELKTLVGKHILQGVEMGRMPKERTWSGDFDDCNYVKFTLDGTHYIALEDPEDGYRSYCENLRTTPKPCRVTLPDIEVEVKYVDARHGTVWREDCDLIEVYDIKNGKLILEVGTENVGDYYPCCIFHYYPENMSCNEGR